jgi:hypothetical protein
MKAPIDVMREVSARFKGSKSICQCGHDGDGTGGGWHAGPRGHGACSAHGCDCQKFTWAMYTRAFNDAVTAARLREGV